MPNHDLASAGAATQSIVAAAHTAATNGTSVDLGNSDGCLIVINYGLADTGVTVIMEDSDDDSTFTTVTAANLTRGAIAAVTTLNDNVSVLNSYKGNKRYLRARLDTVTGTDQGVGITLIELPLRHVNA